MKTKNITNFTLEESFEIGASIIFLIGGLFCLFFPRLSADGILIAAAALTSVSAIILMWQAFAHRHLMDLVKGIGAIILALIFWSERSLGPQLVCALFSFYMGGTGIILIIEGIVDLREKSKTGWHFILFGLIDLLLAGSGIGLLYHDPQLVQRFVGAYLIVQAVQMLTELYIFRHHDGSRSWSFRHWSSLPVYIVAVGPSLALRYARKKHMEDAAFTSVKNKNDLPVNLRVFIHSGLTGDKQFGHMTFAYKDIMFSYGNYDAADEKMFRTYGPGILFTVPADIYVNNSCVYEHSVIFEYGLHLTEEQEEKLKQELTEAFKPTYRWYSPVFEQEPNVERFKKYEKDYSSRLAWRTGSKFYKFRSGVWKTYWVFGRNCSLFASHMLHSIDSQIVIPRGISTPGEYFEYFEEAIQDPASNVINQSIHTAADPETLYPVAL